MITPGRGLSSEYPPDWTPHDPPDDLDDLIREEWQDPTFRDAWDRLKAREAKEKRDA